MSARGLQLSQKPYIKVKYFTTELLMSPYNCVQMRNSKFNFDVKFWPTSATKQATNGQKLVESPFVTTHLNTLLYALIDLHFNDALLIIYNDLFQILQLYGPKRPSLFNFKISMYLSQLASCTHLHRNRIRCTVLSVISVHEVKI